MRTRFVRRIWTTLIAGVLAATAATVVSATSASAAVTPYCGITWGSTVKSAPTHSNASVKAVRAGQHACFDRVVIDLRGPSTGFSVQYVPQITADGSGAVVPVRGGAKLQIVVHAGATAKPALPNVAPYRTLEQIVWANSFEGYTTFGLGVRARLPFRAFVINDPATGTSRLVVDVAHRW